MAANNLYWSSRLSLIEDENFATYNKRTATGSSHSKLPIDLFLVSCQL